jgi:transcriptional regulator with XRE-family HTH domain
MGKKQNIDPIDEMLRIYYLESSDLSETGNISEPLGYLNQLPNKAEMSERKKKRLFDHLLTQTAKSPSFGQLLYDYIQAKNYTPEKLASQVKLSQERIHGLLKDELSTNLIPVKRLKRLLKTLEISFDEVETAIWKTYEIVKESQSGAQKKGNYQVSFRKSFGKNTRVKGTGEADSRNLYQNEEALDKYLNRLKELLENE